MLRTDLFGNTLLTGESQRKNGTYMFRIMKWGRNNCVYDKSIEGLRAKEKILLESINRGYSVLNEEMTLNDIVDFYLERKSNYLQESTLHTMYHEYYGCRNTIGRVRIKELRYSDIMYFFMGRVKTEKNKEGYAISTIERKLSVITGALEMALKDRIIDWNPATGVITEVKKIAKYQNNKVEGLTENQKDRIINYMNENPKYAKDRQIILFLLGTGCRVSEALALRWEDIDFEKNYISINHAITYKNENSGFVVLRKIDENSYASVLGAAYKKYRRTGLGIIQKEQEIVKNLGGKRVVTSVSSNNVGQLKALILNGYKPYSIEHVFIKHND